MERTNNHGRERLVTIPAGRVMLEGMLDIPENANGIVLFVHGSGSSRHSPRNRAIAQHLHDERLGTLLIDLLTAHEEEFDARTHRLRFDIGLLAERVVDVTDWLTYAPDTCDLLMGYFGASTGAAAALVAAANRIEVVNAIVSRGGRPDLAGFALHRVQAPTLFIVGEKDFSVLSLNRAAMGYLHADKDLEIIPRATHLFEEPGALEEVARHASAWFTQHLTLNAVLPDLSFTLGA